MVKRNNTRPVAKEKTRSVNEEFSDMRAELAREKKLRILTPAGFNERYEELQLSHPLLKAEALYEMVEEEHKELAKKRKYSNFDSFRQIRKRLIRGLAAE